MILQNKRLIAIVAAVAILLLIPLVGMQFTDEVNWSLQDFAAALCLLLSTGLSCEFVLRKVKKNQHRIIICVMLIILCLIVWIELAVGIFGTSFAGQ
jgi:hypothetical protein